MIKTEIIPVIHIINTNQLFKNIQTCLECGIEKVFLIDHHSPKLFLLLEDVEDVKMVYPNLWVGINALGDKASELIMLDLPVDGLWCDDSVTIEEYNQKQFKGTYFGGLAFKYQPQPSDLIAASKNASLCTDVACTSGPGTGQPATLAKIQKIREGLGDHPMAIASGVSVDNIHLYAGLVNYLLVASSITDNNEFIIKEKLQQLIEVLNNEL